MASPANEAKTAGAYALVESYSRDDLPLGAEAPEFEKLQLLLKEPPEMTPFDLAVARMSAFRAALLEAVQGEKPAAAAGIVQEYDVWRPEMIKAGSKPDENIALTKLDFSFKQAAKLI